MHGACVYMHMRCWGWLKVHHGHAGGGTGRGVLELAHVITYACRREIPAIHMYRLACEAVADQLSHAYGNIAAGHSDIGQDPRGALKCTQNHRGQLLISYGSAIDLPSTSARILAMDRGAGLID